MPWTIAGRNGDKPQTVTILPHHAVGGNTYGEAMLLEHYRHSRAEVCITVCDVFVFPPHITGKTNFAPWLPVDIDPAPDGIIQALEPAIYPMVYSKWGVEVLERAGVKAHYIPCGVPKNTFCPGDKMAAREQFKVGRDYDFLVTMVAANKDGSDRKGFSEAMLGFAKFLEKRPEAILYIHTDWGGPIKPANIAKRLGIEKSIIQPDQYGYINGMLDEKYMANVYRASDLLLNPCKSEGFGLPLVEAQMCGCPIAATDFATTNELLFGGWKLDGQLDWYAGAESWRKRVYVDSVADVLEEAYRERDNVKLQRKAHNGALRFDIDTVFNHYWKPALADIENLVNGGKKVYDFAQNLGVVPIQRYGRPADRVIPEPDRAA
jgi:glycosyltransferase involved in cell wall biosynthesis